MRAEQHAARRQRRLLVTRSGARSSPARAASRSAASNSGRERLRMLSEVPNMSKRSGPMTPLTSAAPIRIADQNFDQRGGGA